MKIVITDSRTVTHGDIDLSVFQELGEVRSYERTYEDQLKERIKDADVILCNKVPLHAKVLNTAKNLKYIGLFATGYNNVDLEYTNKHGITVTNAGQYSVNAVAQHTFALLLNWFNKIKKYDDFVKEGNWIGLDTFCSFAYSMEELSGKTIGIIGYGSIGREVAKIAKVFSMEVLVYTRTKLEEEGVRFVSREELLEQSDIITIHCPLNVDSYKMCNEAFFSQCKKGAFFINTARGAIVDEHALYEALEGGTLGGAAVDVLKQEPMDEDCILLKAKNITITPHVAWASTDTRQRLVNIVKQNLESFIEGKPINVVGK